VDERKWCWERGDTDDATDEGRRRGSSSSDGCGAEHLEVVDVEEIVLRDFSSRGERDATKTNALVCN